MVEEVFVGWVENHSRILQNTARKLLGDRHQAEDVVQETFSSAWKNRHLFESEKSELAWLMTILRRRVVDHMRKRGRQEAVFNEEKTTIDLDPFENELSFSMKKAFSSLPPELGNTFFLVVVGELTHREAASRLGIPIGTVLSRVSRAKARLHNLLSDKA